MAKFEAGKTYATRSITDHNCVIRVTIVKRTAKTVTTDNGKRFRVSVSPYDGVETIKPYGSYSMCPVISAGRVEP